jgi:DNA-binding NarL/FixJ family response regulator
MTPNPSVAPQNILILKTGRLLSSVLDQVARQLFPDACVHVAASLRAGGAVLTTHPVDLLLTGVSFPDGDAFDLIERYSESRRVLVVTNHWEHRVLAALRILPIRGVFDPTSDGVDELGDAVQLVVEGGHYWSVSVLDRL